MTSETLLIDRHESIVRIALNRPDRLNAFNEEMHGALFAALSEAGNDESVRCILLTGAGRGFCAGQDLSQRDPRKMSAPPDLGALLDRFYNPLIRLVRGIEKPVICAVNGVAAGAGANLALACDIVLAAKSARFIQAFSKIGLVPDAGGTWSLVHLIGEARAKALAMTAMPLDAETAAAWGLIWRAVDDERLSEESESLALSLAQGATIGLGLTKRALQAAATNSLDEQLDLERDLQREASGTPDYAEGVLAFLEKRPARFTGKR